MTQEINRDFFTSALLDVDLADIADLPSFAIPPTGVYQLVVTTTQGGGGDHGPYVEFLYEVADVVEIADAKDKPPTLGDKFVRRFYLEKDKGLEKLKVHVTPYSEHFNEFRLAAVLALIENLAISALVKRKTFTGKDGKDMDFAEISEVSVG